MTQRDPKTGTFHRIAWFVGLWIAGVATLAVIGYGIRYWLGL